MVFLYIVYHLFIFFPTCRQTHRHLFCRKAILDHIQPDIAARFHRVCLENDAALAVDVHHQDGCVLINDRDTVALAILPRSLSTDGPFSTVLRMGSSMSGFCFMSTLDPTAIQQRFAAVLLTVERNKASMLAERDALQAQVGVVRLFVCVCVCLRMCVCGCAFGLGVWGIGV